jgi:hypothetical protein
MKLEIGLGLVGLVRDPSCSAVGLAARSFYDAGMIERGKDTGWVASVP